MVSYTFPLCFGVYFTPSVILVFVLEYEGLNDSVIVYMMSSPSVSELQSLQQLAVQVKKPSVCVKKKERKLSDQVEVSMLAFTLWCLANS